MGVKKLEVRVMPAGNTAGNFMACRPSGMWPVEREMGSLDLYKICTSYPLDNLGRAWEQEGSPWTPSLPPCWQGFFKRASGKVPNSESLVRIPWKFQPMDFSFTFFPFFLGCKDLQGAWPQPVSCVHPTPLPRGRNSPRKSP